jgi:hypothetical protein
MRQISLLGDAPASSRPMRPDRVYRTGVLSPMVGYQPGMAVQAVADAFTTGPQAGLQGPFTGFWGKVSMWWQGVKARAKAGTSQVVALIPAAIQQSAVPTASEPQIHAPGAAVPPVPMGAAVGNPHMFTGRMAPAPYTANLVAPYMVGIPSQMVSAAYGQSTSLPPYAAEAASKTTMMMWRGLRWPWH